VSNLVAMDAQRIFDIVARHLFTQGERALTDGGACAYRGKTGRKCAVGVLIPDSLYNPKLEGHSLCKASVEFYGFPDYFNTYFGLLRSLQRVHDFEDNWASTDAMKAALLEVAQSYKLNASILDSSFFDNK
jgi:hypothetical protein